MLVAKMKSGNGVPLMLISITASVIHSQERLRYVKALLASIAQQVEHVDQYWFSIHVTPEMRPHVDLATLFAPLFSALQRRNQLKILSQRTKKQQFHQYADIVQRIGNSNGNAWILFSDDDDLWHPKRMSIWKTFVRSGHYYLTDEIKSTLGAFIIPQTTRVLPNLSTRCKTCLECDFLHPQDVDRAIQDKACSCVETTRAGTMEKAFAYWEHVNMCVPLTRLRTFVETRKDLIQKNRFADFAFYEYITSNITGTERSAFAPPKLLAQCQWIYFYRQGHDQVTRFSGEHTHARCGTMTNDELFQCLMFSWESIFIKTLRTRGAQGAAAVLYYFYHNNGNQRSIVMTSFYRAMEEYPLCKADIALICGYLMEVEVNLALWLLRELYTTNMLK